MSLTKLSPLHFATRSFGVNIDVTVAKLWLDSNTNVNDERTAL